MPKVPILFKHHDRSAIPQWTSVQNLLANKYHAGCATRRPTCDPWGANTEARCKLSSYLKIRHAYIWIAEASAAEPISPQQDVQSEIPALQAVATLLRTVDSEAHGNLSFVNIPHTHGSEASGTQILTQDAGNSETVTSSATASASIIAKPLKLVNLRAWLDWSPEEYAAILVILSSPCSQVSLTLTMNSDMCQRPQSRTSGCSSIPS
jgi:hypothetical protein